MGTTWGWQREATTEMVAWQRGSVAIKVISQTPQGPVGSTGGAMR